MNVRLLMGEKVSKVQRDRGAKVFLRMYLNKKFIVSRQYPLK